MFGSIQTSHSLCCEDTIPIYHIYIYVCDLHIIKCFIFPLSNKNCNRKWQAYLFYFHFQRPIRFAVRSLGWVEIAEADLTPERSSKAVNKCIVDLSMGRNDILDVVGRWGDVS